MTRSHLLLLALLGLAATASAQLDGPDVSPSIIKTLERHLKPTDLDLPVKKLRSKIDAIGDFFEVAEDREVEQSEVPMHGLSKVQGSSREVMAVLESTKRQYSPNFTYWIGVIRGKIAVKTIPKNKDDMIGPIYGDWRRRGKYLVGVGYNASYHSPAWADGELDVLTDTANGPKMIQRIGLGPRRLPGFIDTASFTVDSCENTDDGFSVIETTRYIRPRCDKIYEFRNGRYFLARTVPTHDKTWAIDHLLTAVFQHRQNTINAMIPNATKRRLFQKRLQTALHQDADQYEESEGIATVTSKSHPNFELDLEMKKTKSGWVLTNAEIEYVKD